MGEVNGATDLTPSSAAFEEMPGGAPIDEGGDASPSRDVGDVGRSEEDATDASSAKRNDGETIQKNGDDDARARRRWNAENRAGEGDVDQDQRQNAHTGAPAAEYAYDAPTPGWGQHPQQVYSDGPRGRGYHHEPVYDVGVFYDGVGAFGVPPPGRHDGGRRLETVHCPQALVGRLIGKQGETIKDLQRRSGARIQIDQNFPEGMPRLVTVEGEPRSVQIGVDLVNTLIGSAPPSSGVSADAAGHSSGPGSVVTFDCPKSLVGRVIGKGGETINALQRRSGARIQIEQRVPEGQPCIVEVQGKEAAVQEAIRLTREVMNGNHIDSGMSVSAAAGYQQQHMMMQYSYGAAAGYPRHVQHGGYGGYAAPYGVPAYGYPPPAAYGAYASWPVGYAAQQQQPAQNAVPGAPAPPPPRTDGWSSHSDGQGRTYWHNSITRQSTWTAPR